MSIKLWPFRPDWEAGVLERLEWLTDMMASTKGAEQRRPQRLTPRRTFEATFLPHGRQRSVFDLLVMEKGNDDWYIPLWFDHDVLREDTPAALTELYTDYEDREFTAGGLAVIRPVTSADHEHHTFTYELVRVVNSKQNRLVVVRGQEGTVARDWPRGSEIYPVRQARFMDQPNVSIVSASIVSTNMKFVVTEPNEWHGGKHYSGYGDAYGRSYGKYRDVSPRTPAKNLGTVASPWFMPAFEGIRVMNAEPDYNQDMSYTYDRLLNILDNENGIPKYTDSLGFATPAQQHTWFLNGRAEQAAYRTMLYFLRGKVKPVWLPTFADDVQLIAPTPAGQNWIDIRKIGYTDGGRTVISRQCLAIQKNNGEWHFARITGCANVGDHERLELSMHFLEDLNPKDIYKISFMAVARLDQDGIEINHVTDNKGLAKSVITFRVAPNIRQYVPWAVTWPPTWRACDRTCAQMPRVENIVGFGLPNEDWSIEDTITTTQYAWLYYALCYSQKYISTETLELDELQEYFAWALGGPFGGRPWVYNPQSVINSFNFQYYLWTGYNRAAQLQFLGTVLPDKFLEEIASFDDKKLYDYYIRQQMYWSYQTYMESGWQCQHQNVKLHIRNWLPFKRLTEIPQSCKNNMLGKFCVQSTYTRSPIDRHPTNARGSHNVYAAGLIHEMLKHTSPEWPLDQTLLGQSYSHAIMPYNGNGLHSSCGCLALQFVESHNGLRTQLSDPSDDSQQKVLWWHRAEAAWLTPAPWPNQIRLLMYDSLTGYLLRTLDMDVENYPVSGYGTEFDRPAWHTEDDEFPEPQIYNANLVVFRKSYGREDSQTLLHPDPWDNIWNVVPLNSKGFVVEVYPR